MKILRSGSAGAWCYYPLTLYYNRNSGPGGTAVFAHVDINNCYVSCETLFQPRLKGRIVVVLSNNDGCVIARSNEAKAIGIKMGDAEFMVRKTLQEHDAVVFSSNYALYADMSARMMNNLARYTYMLMVYSIDEAFMALGNISGIDLEKHAEMISKNVIRDTGLSITIGVGPTLSLAKLANKAAKKQGKAYLVLDTSERIDATVKTFPIEEMSGVLVGPTLINCRSSISKQRKISVS